MKHRLARLALSAFLLVHLAAILVWNLPESALKQRIGSWAGSYLLPTGQWQHWGMFAPEPLRETLALEAQARDSQGIIHIYKFPRMADRPVAAAFSGYRHSKFSHNLLAETAVAYREFAARHAARSWNLPAASFPLDLDLYHNMWRPAEIGQPPADPSRPPEIRFLQAYRFASPQDLLP